LESHISSSFKKHDRTDWKGSSHTQEKSPNVRIIPDPAALKSGSWIFPSTICSKSLLKAVLVDSNVAIENPF
jgi:hypothetical protein